MKKTHVLRPLKILVLFYKKKNKQTNVPSLNEKACINQGRSLTTKFVFLPPRDPYPLTVDFDNMIFSLFLLLPPYLYIFDNIFIFYCSHYSQKH